MPHCPKRSIWGGKGRKAGCGASGVRKPSWEHPQPWICSLICGKSSSSWHVSGYKWKITQLTNKLLANKWALNVLLAITSTGLFFDILCALPKIFSVDLRMSADPISFPDGGSPSSLAGLFRGKSQSKMDDDWGGMGSPILGTLHILEMIDGWLMISWMDFEMMYPRMSPKRCPWSGGSPSWFGIPNRWAPAREQPRQERSSAESDSEAQFQLWEAGDQET